MPNVQVKVKYECQLEGEIPANTNNLASAAFRVFYGPASTGPWVDVLFTPSTRRLLATSTMEADQGVLAELGKKVPYDQLSTAAKEAKGNLTLMTRDAARTVAAQLKYRLGWTGIREDLVSIPTGGGDSWSLDGNTWNGFPPQIQMLVSIEGMAPIDANHLARIQKLLDKGDTPWLAWRHLHRAKKELLPRDKWLEATLALELGIKEFLVRLKPDLESFVMEVPSPPLHKLFGTVLESLVGRRSSFVKEIQKGVEVRNQLIHRPKDIPIDGKSAQDYVRVAEAALRELETILGISY